MSHYRAFLLLKLCPLISRTWDLCILLSRSSFLSFFLFSSFAPRPRCNWLSEGRPRRKGQVSCLEANYEGLILSIAIRLQYIILSSRLTRGVGPPSTFLKLLLSTLCFTNYRDFHLFFVSGDCARIAAVPREESGGGIAATRREKCIR